MRVTDAVAYVAWLVMYMTYGPLDDFLNLRDHIDGFFLGLLRFMRSLMKPTVTLVALLLLYHAALSFGWTGRIIMVIVCAVLLFVPIYSYSPKWRWAANMLVAIVFTAFLYLTHVIC